jgi:uncharacterized membrane protein
MLVIVFSLLAAFFFAAHYVAVKFGMRTSNPMTATLISSITNALFLWIITLLFLPFDFFWNKGMLYLAIAGLLAPCLARVFMYTGIEKVGVSITSPIKETAQFFAAFAAIVFLGERLTNFIGLATIMTVMGVILLSRSSGDSKLTGQLQWKKKRSYLSLWSGNTVWNVPCFQKTWNDYGYFILGRCYNHGHRFITFFSNSLHGDAE